MNADFSRVLSLLRQEKGISQRRAAAALGISQALLSHYENGLREPGLSFVVRAADYYGVSCDYLLGRSMARDGSAVPAGRMAEPSQPAQENAEKKLVSEAVALLLDLAGRAGSRQLPAQPLSAGGSVGRALPGAHHRDGRLLVHDGHPPLDVEHQGRVEDVPQALWILRVLNGQNPLA